MLWAQPTTLMLISESTYRHAIQMWFMLCCQEELLAAVMHVKRTNTAVIMNYKSRCTHTAHALQVSTAREAQLVVNIQTL